MRSSSSESLCVAENDAELTRRVATKTVNISAPQPDPQRSRVQRGRASAVRCNARCFEVGLLRPAVVSSWVGAVAILHEHVVTHKLAAFNAEAKRRDSKWRDAVTTDDLGRMKEHEFLDVIESLSVIGKNVKQVLQNQCLNLRNACGRPSSLVISENNVAAHLDTLILNVYSKY